MLLTDLRDFELNEGEGMLGVEWVAMGVKSEDGVGARKADLRGFRGESVTLGLGLVMGDLGIRVKVETQEF